MTAITFDTFKFIRRLKESGIPESQAEAISDAIQEAHATQIEDLATKRDLQELGYRTTIRTGLMLVTVAGMLFTALRYFPPTQPVLLSNHPIPTLEQGKTLTPVQPAVPNPAP